MKKEKVLKNTILVIIVLLMFSCKTDGNNTTSGQKTKILNLEKTDNIKDLKNPKFKTENLNYLKESDTIAVQKFKQQLVKAIMKFVQFYYMDKNITLKEKKKSLQTYFEPIMELCLQEVMTEYNINQLEGEDYFDEKEVSQSCFTYNINNSFSSLEVTYIFIFEKVDGEIKLVSIETIG